jgi:RHS repeat-associated protein
MRHRTRTVRSLGAIALVYAFVGIAEVSAQNLPASCTGFTDDPLLPGVTTVQAQHVTELRACVDDLRVEVSLARVEWSDLVLQAEQTWIQAVHITQLRAALHDVYVARGQAAVPYTDPALTPNTTVVRAAHITEIRQAALRVAGACTPEDCGGPVNTALEYFHLDALGSVRAVTDEAGVVLRRHDYFPFGEGDAPPAGDNPLGFAGKEGDPESGLSYFEARYYRAWVGRFTTVDPGHVDGSLFNPQGWNAYAYARNNPVTNVDPNGLLAQGPGSGCSAEFSFGGCGGEDLFWAEGGWGYGGFEFGDNYAKAQRWGYVPGMPADVWQALDDFNNRPLESAAAEILAATAAAASATTTKIIISETYEVPQEDGKTTKVQGETHTTSGAASPFATVAGDVWNRSGAMTKPSTYGWLLGGSAAAGGLGALGIAQGPTAMRFAVNASQQLSWSYKFQFITRDVLQGLTPTPIPASLGGALGFGASIAVDKWVIPWWHGLSGRP